MITFRYVYITRAPLQNGEISVQGRDKDGKIVFGFRAVDDGFQLWREKARAYTPSSYIPVFGSRPSGPFTRFQTDAPNPVLR